MLGKGLESLIPQKGGNDDDRDNAVQNTDPAQPAWKPQSLSDPQAVKSFYSSSALPSGDDNPPPLDLPILPDELDLPSGEDIVVSPVRPDPQPIKKEEPAKPVFFAREAASSASSSMPAAQKPVMNSKQEDSAIGGSIFHIEVEKIVPNPNQPRRVFDQEALRDMANSIREFGVLQPLVVTKIKKETQNGVEVEYQLIAGERRLLASKIAGMKTVPAIIRNVGLEREKFELAIIENLQRENLNAIETARAFERLRDEFKLTQREIAAKLGKSREVVANAVRLLDLPAYAQEAVQEGTINESTARFLLAIEDPSAQRKLFDEMVQNKLTARDVRDRVRNYTKRPGRPPGSLNKSSEITPELRAVQEELSSELGAPVEIEKKADTGKIMITFYSQEELDNILKRLGKN